MNEGIDHTYLPKYLVSSRIRRESRMGASSLTSNMIRRRSHLLPPSDLYGRGPRMQALAHSDIVRSGIDDERGETKDLISQCSLSLFLSICRKLQHHPSHPLI